MFMSLTNSFSVQIINPASGSRMSWLPIKDEETLFEYLKKLCEHNYIYRVAGVNWLGNACMVTHKYCQRMIWGIEAFGVGLK